jgi:hypothetical protein
MQKVELNRFSWRSDCTLGDLILPGTQKLVTLELPWQKNQRRISCIPAGTYIVHKRFKGLMRSFEAMVAFAKSVGVEKIPEFAPGKTLIYNYVTRQYWWVFSNQNFGDHYHVQNVAGRSGILFHTGNYTHQINGCILPGRRHMDLNGDKIPDVTHSRWALNVMLSQLGDQFELKIT